ncbi:MAG: ferrous iron transport protein A [Leptolyngbyaceae cyanobacterium SM2_3_12]|nr:ferrous iron transport protein A [Leptolyngbyaceae cyanobacterium SM2_3_12]
MFTGFTISGASLQLLKVGEQGVISRLKKHDPSIVEQLEKMGLYPGTPITLEQRFPHFLVRTEAGQLTLTEAMIRAIYVRLMGGK